MNPNPGLWHGPYSAHNTRHDVPEAGAPVRRGSRSQSMGKSESLTTLNLGFLAARGTTTTREKRLQRK